MDCGINEEVCAATILEVLFGFLWNVDLMTPTICDLGAELCGWSGIWGMVRSCCGFSEMVTDLVIISCCMVGKMFGSWLMKYCRSTYLSTLV